MENATSISEVKISLDVPATVEEADFSIEVVIADDHAKNPLSNKYQIPFAIKKSNDFVVDFASLLLDVQIEDIPAPELIYKPIDREDNIGIEFNELMLFPDGIKEWNSQNKGKDVF